MFYVEPRLLGYIDDYAIAAVRDLYAELLPPHAAIPDLMSSYKSHMPPGLAAARLVGVGMNEVELRENDQLTEHLVTDLNRDPVLPYRDGEFDRAVVTVSVQYLTRPVEIFREVGRVLKPSAPFIVTYSNRRAGTTKGSEQRKMNLNIDMTHGRDDNSHAGDREHYSHRADAPGREQRIGRRYGQDATRQVCG